MSLYTCYFRKPISRWQVHMVLQNTEMGDGSGQSPLVFLHHPDINMQLWVVNILSLQFSLFFILRWIPLHGLCHVLFPFVSLGFRQCTTSCLRRGPWRRSHGWRLLKCCRFLTIICFVYFAPVSSCGILLKNLPPFVATRNISSNFFWL